MRMHWRVGDVGEGVSPNVQAMVHVVAIVCVVGVVGNGEPQP